MFEIIGDVNNVVPKEGYKRSALPSFSDVIYAAGVSLFSLLIIVVFQKVNSHLSENFDFFRKMKGFTRYVGGKWKEEFELAVERINEIPDIGGTLGSTKAVYLDYLQDLASLMEKNKNEGVYSADFKRLIGFQAEENIYNKIKDLVEKSSKELEKEYRYLIKDKEKQALEIDQKMRDEFYTKYEKIKELSLISQGIISEIRLLVGKKGVTVNMLVEIFHVALDKVKVKVHL